MNLNEDGVCICKQVIPKQEAIAWAKTAVTDLHAHSELMWRIRTDERILAIFANLWGTRDLLTSFDGIGHRAPYNVWELEWHVDQDRCEDVCVCVQGLLCLSYSSAANGGAQFALGSHMYHAECMRVVKPGRRKWQFVPLKSEMLSGFKKRQPSLKPGDMLLWDSRVAHRVLPPRIANTERTVAYVCMTPLGFAPPGTLARRRDAFSKGVASTHWPHLFCERRGENRQAPPWSYAESPEMVRILVDGNLSSR